MDGQVPANQEEFKDVVNRDVRGKSTPEESEFLRSGEQLVMWRDALREILQEVETQSLHRKADAEAFRTACFRKGPEGKNDWFEYKAGWDAWKSGAARFKRNVQVRLNEAKRLIQERGAEDAREQYRQLLVEALQFLNRDEAITYKCLPDRDELREKISSALYK